MLRRFLYLNSSTVDSYLGVIEGGLSDESTHRSEERGKRGGEGSIGIRPFTGKFGGERERTEGDERVIRDTPELRFDRLMAALDSEPEQWNYEQVLETNRLFERLSPGTLISVDCEVSVPPMSLLFAQPEQLNGMLDMLEMLGPMAAAFGESLDGMPDPAQVQAVRQFTRMSADVIVVGDIDDDAPRVAGKLEKDYIREIPDGEATIVGKVTRRWNRGEHYSLMALPGAAIMNRAQRRRAEPPKSDDENVMHGPAFTLDIVAIFR